MKISFLLLTTAAAVSLNAQKSSRLFSVTDQEKGGYNWSAIRSLSGAKSNQVIINNFVAKGSVIDASLQRKKADYGPDATNLVNQPMYSGVAALAYDQQHDRLYFATMFTQQLRYIELSDSKPDRYFQAANLADLVKTKQVVTNEQQGPVVTRMTIAPDGYGYGISNDGQNFFRFSLDKKTQVESLGSLVDDAKNESVSVHNQCSSWGGDIVASAKGDLYLFTMRQMVFRINPFTKVATYLGKITGLDNNFSVNGAAVDESGNVVLSTAAYAGSRGVIKDMNSLVATEDKNEDYYNASDLASCNFLFVNTSVTPKPVTVFEKSGPASISLYPNPTRQGFTMVSFDKKVFGKLTIDVLSGSGSTVIRKPVQVTSEGQQVRLNTNTLAKGLYVIRVTDASSKEVYNSKLVVE
jgi:hypothetical protein